MRSLILISVGVLGIQGQANFGGSSSSRRGSSSSSSSSSSSNSNNKDANQKIFGLILPSTGNAGTDGLLNGGLLGAGLAAGAGALLGSASNPCGRKKRQTNNKIFGLFGSGNTNCGGSSGNFGQCDCECSTLTFFSNGQTHGNCQQADNTGRYWCYTTGYGNRNCGDLQSSNRFPNNPWSYNACQRQHQCSNNNSRDCKGRPLGDKYFGCGCSRRKRQDSNTRFFDLRCAEATILGRKVQK